MTHRPADHRNSLGRTYDAAWSTHLGGAQPKNPRLGEKHRFAYEYRPALALSLRDTTIAPKVFQRKRSLALFLERVVVKALASTARRGVLDERRGTPLRGE